MRNLKQHMPGGYTEQYMDTKVAIYCSRCVYPEGICGTYNRKDHGMSIVSNYIWEKGTGGGRNPVSLAVQQVKLQVGLQGREICLFCVCESMKEEPGGRMTERLVEWFHKSCLPACGGRRLPTPREMLDQELYSIRKDLLGLEENLQQDGINYAGLLLIGSSFYLFGEGDMKVQLVNYRYNRPQLRELEVPLSGRIQKGVGLLLHTPQFTESLDPAEVCQILHGEGRWQEERIGRRLKELFQEGRSRGSTGAVGGIYLHVL